MVLAIQICSLSTPGQYSLPLESWVENPEEGFYNYADKKKIRWLHPLSIVDFGIAVLRQVSI